MHEKPDLYEYLAFTPDHDEADAAAAFLARFGQPPEFIIEALGVLFVGPVPTPLAVV